MPNRQSWDDNLRDVLISYKKGIYAFLLLTLVIYSFKSGLVEVQMIMDMVQTVGDFIGNL